MNGSCHAHGWVMSLVWTHHDTRWSIEESNHPYEYMESCHTSLSCITLEWVCALEKLFYWWYVPRVMNECVVSHTWVSHVTHMNKSSHTYEWVSHTYEWVMSHLNESCHTYASVMSHIWMSQVTHINQSSHTYEWDESHVQFSPVTRMDALCSWLMLLLLLRKK